MEFTKDVFGVSLDPWQEKALNNLAHNQKVAVAGCTGVGKDFMTACAVWWYLSTRDYPKVICTAVKQETLRDNLWAELSMLMRKSPLMQAMFEYGMEKIYRKGAAEEWFAVARTASKRYGGGGEAQAEGLAGKYSDDTLAVVDEASGVDDANIQALEGSANTPRRKMLMIGNPLRRNGYFAKVFLDQRYKEGWTTQNVSYLDSVRTSDPENAKIRKRWIEMYGMESAYVQARVFGQFPSSSTVDTIFTRDELSEAVQRNEELLDDTESPVCIGIDVARYGDDETVYYVRRGRKSLDMVCESQSTGPQVEGRAVFLAEKYCPKGKDPREWVEFRIDETGLGGHGAVDHLREEGWQVAGVHNGSKTILEEDYRSLGDELWMEDGKDAIRWCGLYPDDILVNQLESRTYTFTGKAKQRRLSTKDEMRRSGYGSPDRADAFILAFARREHLEYAPTNVDSLRKTISFL